MNTCLYNRPSKDTTWMEMIDLSAEYGFDCLEVFTGNEFTEPDETFAEAFRKHADEKGVKICCLSSFADITGDDADLQIARMKGFARVAAIIGSPYLHHTVCRDFEHPEAILSRKEEWL